MCINITISKFDNSQNYIGVPHQGLLEGGVY